MCFRVTDSMRSCFVKYKNKNGEIGTYFFLSSSGLVIILFPVSCLLVQILRDGGSISLPEQVFHDHIKCFTSRLAQVDVKGYLNFHTLTTTTSLPHVHVSHLMYSSRTCRNKKTDIQLSYINCLYSLLIMKKIPVIGGKKDRKRLR